MKAQGSIALSSYEHMGRTNGREHQGASIGAVPPGERGIWKSCLSKFSPYEDVALFIIMWLVRRAACLGKIQVQ
jgi:hypothetical protein